MIELFFRDKSSALDSKAAGATVYEGKLKIQRGVLQCKRKLLISERRIQIVDRDRSTIVIDNKRLLRAVRLIGDTDSVAALVQPGLVSIVPENPLSPVIMTASLSTSPACFFIFFPLIVMGVRLSSDNSRKATESNKNKR